ncbi:hypothetical protein KKC32_04745 [Patescibacteria group bacterium]|nr:hypothetical protein [Patescibacteria group bacterium]
MIKKAKKKNYLGFLILALCLVAIVPMILGIWSLVSPQPSMATDFSNVLATANVTSAPPVASSVILRDANTFSETNIILNPSSTATVECLATISDNNGCDDITGVSAKIYRSGATPACLDDNNDCYTDAECSVGGDCTSGGADLDVSYTCNAALQFYADATDTGPLSAQTWQCEVTPTDGVAGDPVVDATPPDVDSLPALTVLPTSIAYGELALGGTSATSKQVVVTNVGNRSLDIYLKSTASTAMTCDIGTIPLANEKYHTTENFDFDTGGGVALTDEDVTLVLDLAAPTDDVDPVISDATEWELRMPATGVEGFCTGTNMFTVYADND